MNKNKVWLITGAGRGMGLDIAKVALAAGYKVVATGRNTNKVAEAIGKSADLFVVKLDVTNPSDAQSAVKAALDQFGRIDVLVNNAASFYAGFFEELTPDQIEQQLLTSLIGPMTVTRAVLPVMRKQRAGHIISISSSAGLTSFDFCSAYSASKFGLEESTNYARPAIEDYNERREQQMLMWKSQNGQQPGDPAKLAQALITIANQEEPPRRFIAGADAIQTAEHVVAQLQEQINAYRELSASLAFANS